jgi:hypothetical protein
MARVRVKRNHLKARQSHVAHSSKNAVSISSAHDEMLPVVAMCVNNPDRLPFKIQH